jgi:hypothetical protein
MHPVQSTWSDEKLDLNPPTDFHDPSRDQKRALPSLLVGTQANSHYISLARYCGCATPRTILVSGWNFQSTTNPNVLA